MGSLTLCACDASCTRVAHGPNDMTSCPRQVPERGQREVFASFARFTEASTVCDDSRAIGLHARQHLAMLHSRRLTTHRATQGGISLMTTLCGQLNEIPRGLHLQPPLRRAP